MRHFQPVLVGISRLALGLVLGLGPGEASPRLEASGAGDAIAFVRVFGDVRIVTEDGDGPVLEDREIGTGTAFVVAPSGLLLTNHHVVSDGALVRVIEGVEIEARLEVKRVEVALPGEGGHQTFEASIVGSDADLDLAVLQVTARELPYLPLGDSEAMVPGDGVTVLGFPFGRVVDVGRRASPDAVPSPTVTTGALSAARSGDDGETRYLQTDATVHPGSSGGPILNEEGFVVGVVSMKLVHPDDPEGPAFGIPVSLAKDFLEANGVLFQVPGTRLGPGVVHELDWKGVRVRLPDGAVDVSEERLRVDTGASGGPVSFLSGRVVTPASLRTLEEALLRGRVLPGFVPAGAASPERIPRPVGGRLQGWVQGAGPEGERFRVEYMLAEVGSGNEKVLARYLGPAEDIGFNLSLVRDSLEGLEATALLREPVTATVTGEFEGVSAAGWRGVVPLPRGWTREPTTGAGCVRVPPAEDGLAARPPGDFTVALRVLRWPATGFDAGRVANACGRPEGTPPLAYARRYRKMGVDTGVWGAFRKRGAEVLLFEVEAPQSKLPFLRDLYVEWLDQIAQ